MIPTVAVCRRDELRNGDAFKSSHGFIVYVAEVVYSGSPDTPRDERTVSVHGWMHRPGGHPHVECYPGNGEVALVGRGVSNVTELIEAIQVAKGELGEALMKSTPSAKDSAIGLALAALERCSW